MIEMVRSLKVSHDVIEILKTKDNKIKGYIDTFNNCRETGYVLKVWQYGDIELDGKVIIWVHEHRSSDSIVLRYTTKLEDIDINNMFNESVHINGTEHFRVNQEEEVADYIIELLQKIVVEKENEKKN